ncbi:MAG: hypothetical protein HQL72_05500 [Magnetococcales bacterium]|nr:hypothetical protein [Magnetococcales bacterium]
MKSYLYSLSDKLTMTLSCRDDDPAIECFVSEWHYLQRSTDQAANLPKPVAKVSIVDQLQPPENSTIYMHGQFLIHDQDFYFNHLDHWLTIKVDKRSFCVVAERNMHPYWVYYVTETLLRAYAPLYGVAFLHASGFRYQGHHFIISAFGGTGKTNMLLDILEQNGIYFGDDLIPVCSDGYLYPYRKQLNLLPYNFAYKPGLLVKAGQPTWLLSLQTFLTTKSTAFFHRLITYKLLTRVRARLTHKLDYHDVATQDDPGERFPVDHLIWLERNSHQQGPFPLSPKKYRNDMQVCLDIENRHLGHFMDYLTMVNPHLHKLTKKQAELIEHIAKKCSVIGLHKLDGDEKGLLQYIHQLANNS